MRWIGWNHLSTNKNVVDVEEKDTTYINVQCNLNVEVVKLTDLCIGFHSTHGWELVIGFVYKDFGFAQNDQIYGTHINIIITNLKNKLINDTFHFIQVDKQNT